MSLATISASSFAQRHQEGQEIDLIDVRIPVEFREVHVQFAHNVPLDQLDPAQSSRREAGLPASRSTSFVRPGEGVKKPAKCCNRPDFRT